MGKTASASVKNARSSIYLPRVATLKEKRPMTPYDTFFEFDRLNPTQYHLQI
jgi:hypothetical protein